VVDHRVGESANEKTEKLPSPPSSPADSRSQQSDGGQGADDELQPPNGKKEEDVAETEVAIPEPAEPTGNRGTELGDTIYEISGKDFDGVNFSLNDYAGKVVMVDFWGDW
jgi:hypothetical protein